MILCRNLSGKVHVVCNVFDIAVNSAINMPCMWRIAMSWHLRFSRTHLNMYMFENRVGVSSVDMAAHCQFDGYSLLAKRTLCFRLHRVHLVRVTPTPIQSGLFDTIPIPVVE